MNRSTLDPSRPEGDALCAVLLSILGVVLVVAAGRMAAAALGFADPLPMTFFRVLFGLVVGLSSAAIVRALGAWLVRRDDRRAEQVG